jgi:hypothetical protein
LFLWSLNEIPRFGWIFALGYAVCAALRLARFNASIDTAEHPRKTAGFLTGVPAPLGAGLMLVPVAMWLWSDIWWFRDPYFICVWATMVGFLMISDIATYSWSSLHISRASSCSAISRPFRSARHPITASGGGAERRCRRRPNLHRANDPEPPFRNGAERRGRRGSDAQRTQDERHFGTYRCRDGRDRNEEHTREHCQGEKLKHRLALCRPFPARRLRCP